MIVCQKEKMRSVSQRVTEEYNAYPPTGFGLMFDIIGHLGKGAPNGFSGCSVPAHPVFSFHHIS